jgi:hypothetical protein
MENRAYLMPAAMLQPQTHSDEMDANFMFIMTRLFLESSKNGRTIIYISCNYDLVCMTLSSAPFSFSDAIDPLSPRHSDCANVSTPERLGKDARQFTTAVVLSVFAWPCFPKTFSIDSETCDANPPSSVRLWIPNPGTRLSELVG